jgi:predicted phosphoadenosine phosphosulfate sulfurtransferase
MKHYQKENVYEAAIERLFYLYAHFDHVVCAVSGGKDSDVVLHLCIEVAKKLGKLPVDAMFIDQECEWVETIAHMREIKAMPDVRLHWFQVPVSLHNAAAVGEVGELNWADGYPWCREKEPDSIQERLAKVSFENVIAIAPKTLFESGTICSVGGVRASENPRRELYLTHGNVYNGITWGSKEGEKKGGVLVFYPIYDWLSRDVWHYISINDITYCKLYDKMFRSGISENKMRVSSLTHVFAIAIAKDIQLLSPQTWGQVVKKWRGMHSTKAMCDACYKAPDKLPFMFGSWEEYSDYLIDNLIDPDEQKKYRKPSRAIMEKSREKGIATEIIGKLIVSAILTKSDEFGRIINRTISTYMSGGKSI